MGEEREYGTHIVLPCTLLAKIQNRREVGEREEGGGGWHERESESEGKRERSEEVGCFGGLEKPAQSGKPAQ